MLIFMLRFSVSSLKRKDVITLFNSLSGPVSVRHGCLGISLAADINRDNTFLFMEEWGSRAALESHIRSDEFRKILALMDLANESPTICFHKVSSTEGFELLKKIREKTQNT